MINPFIMLMIFVAEHGAGLMCRMCEHAGGQSVRDACGVHTMCVQVVPDYAPNSRMVFNLDNATCTRQAARQCADDEKHCVKAVASVEGKYWVSVRMHYVPEHTRCAGAKGLHRYHEVVQVACIHVQNTHGR
jgi:hypothetical protein